MYLQDPGSAVSATMPAEEAWIGRRFAITNLQVHWQRIRRICLGRGEDDPVFASRQVASTQRTQCVCGHSGPSPLSWTPQLAQCCAGRQPLTARAQPCPGSRRELGHTGAPQGLGSPFLLRWDSRRAWNRMCKRPLQRRIEDGPCCTADPRWPVLYGGPETPRNQLHTPGGCNACFRATPGRSVILPCGT